MGLSQDDSVGIVDWLRDLTYGEVHLMVLGLYSGFVAVRPRRRLTPRGPGLPETADDWYFRGMYVAGYVLKAVVLVGLVLVGVL